MKLTPCITYFWFHLWRIFLKISVIGCLYALKYTSIASANDFEAIQIGQDNVFAIESDIGVRLSGRHEQVGQNNRLTITGQTDDFMINTQLVGDDNQVELQADSIRSSVSLRLTGHDNQVDIHTTGDGQLINIDANISDKKITIENY